MKALSKKEMSQVNGGSWEMGLAETWVGTVAGVALGAVGAPLLVGAAVGFALGSAFIAADSLGNI